MTKTPGKKLAQDVLNELPDDATIEDVQYGLYVAELVQRRAAQLNEAVDAGVDQSLANGTLVSHGDVVKRMTKWLRR